MNFLKMAVVLILFILSLMFFTQNQQTLATAVDIRFSLFSSSAPTVQPTEQTEQASEQAETVASTAADQKKDTFSMLKQMTTVEFKKVALYHLVLLAFAAGILLTFMLLLLDNGRLRWRLLQQKRETAKAIRDKSVLERKLGIESAAGNQKALGSGTTNTAFDATSDSIDAVEAAENEGKK